jgi:response regulator RpfG family c-di-GMP phosphodiesterase
MATISAQALPVLLCVDDEPGIRKSLQRLFMGQPYQIELAGSGQQALELMQRQRVQVIISDMRMPEMNGAEFLAQAAKIQPDCYRILMTGYADLASTVQAINLGKIHRYVQKPWNNQELQTLVDEGLEMYRLQRANKQLTAQVAKQNQELKTLNHNLEEMVHHRTGQLKKTLSQLKILVQQLEHDHKASLEVLYNIISSDPALSGEFALNVSQTCAALGRQLGVERQQLQHMRQAGLFSELGKIGLPATIQANPFYKLTPLERTQYMQHPQYAEEILAPALHLAPVREAIAQQYERFNGSGEPLHKVGTDISLNARVLTVARDFWMFVFQRMTPQKHSMDQALEQIRRQQGTWYDPEIVMALTTLIRTGMRLGSGEPHQGLSAAELQPGMRLKHNLYNAKKLLLLPKGQLLNAATIDSLQRYEVKHKEILQVPVDQASPLDQSEEE